MGQPAKSASSRGNLFDWLKNLDKSARKFHPADGWWSYSLFLFARYPHLRPRNASQGRLDKALQTSGCESLANLILDWEKRIAAHAQAKRAMEGLTSEQRIQVAAMVVDTETDYQNFASRKSTRVWSQKLGKEGPGRKRMLARKLENARRALNELREYATGLDATLGHDYQMAANDALDSLARVAGDVFSKNYHLALYHDLCHITEDPTTFAMIRLYWFFRSGCGQSGDESEVRVAIIRNAFWTPFGVAPVDFLPQYQPGESLGCQAVHEAVRRFHPHKAHRAKKPS
jgi:hypothetical protein